MGRKFCDKHDDDDASLSQASHMLVLLLAFPDKLTAANGTLCYNLLRGSPGRRSCGCDDIDLTSLAGKLWEEQL